MALPLPIFLSDSICLLDDRHIPRRWRGAVGGQGAAGFERSIAVVNGDRLVGCQGDIQTGLPAFAGVGADARTRGFHIANRRPVTSVVRQDHQVTIAVNQHSLDLAFAIKLGLGSRAGGQERDTQDDPAGHLWFNGCHCYVCFRHWSPIMQLTRTPANSALYEQDEQFESRDIRPDSELSWSS